MKTKLTYIGTNPIFALKKEWVNNSSLTIGELFKLFGRKFDPTLEEPTAAFLEWLVDSYITKLGPNFELEVCMNDFTEVESATINSVIVESAAMKPAASLADAAKNLVKEKQRNAVSTATTSVGGENKEGQTVVATSEVKTNKTQAERIREANSISTVITGDNLRPSSIGKSRTSVALDQHSQPKSLIPTSKEEQAKRDSQFANISGNTRVLTETMLREDGTTEVVNVGGGGHSLDETEKPETVAKGKNSKHKFFQGTESNRVEIKSEDIFLAVNEVEANRLIESCSSSSVLRSAKKLLENIGNHNRVSSINIRLRKLPVGK